MSPFVIAQEDDDYGRDTIKGYDVGKMVLKNPTSIKEAYTYDPEKEQYVYNNKFGEYNIDFPLILTKEQFEARLRKESIRKYFKEKIDAIDGKKEGSEELEKNLLPVYKVNSNVFESIFGSNTIDVQPRGSVEMDFGVRYTKQDNPSFSPRNRTNTIFDFDQRVNMSLTGKVGTRVDVNINYDTQSMFNFNNQIKLEYSPDEDSILQKVEIGNINLPLNNTLIRGAQSLFGLKTIFQFGKTTITGVFSEQRSQTRAITSEGGGTVQDFELFALDYDADRHFFLSQYFRNQYDKSLEFYPFINSRVQITRLEVWVTNRQNRVNTGPQGNNIRNLIALQDLGESPVFGVPQTDIVGLNPIPGNFFSSAFDTPSDNRNNLLDPNRISTGNGLLNSNIRQMVSTQQGFNFTAIEGVDYARLENARKLTPAEYTFHPQLGYISLQQRLSNDEVLAVAYQFTIGDRVYQVGEFANDGVESTLVGPNTQVPETQSLILKLLKSTLTNVDMPNWNLMMKNVYEIPGGAQLTQDDFRFNILYVDPAPLNYIVPFEEPNGNIPLDLPENVKETPLLNVFNLDRLNFNNDVQQGGDGFFDFIPGLTVDSNNGRIIFTSVEPFGKYLFEKLKNPLNPSENYTIPSTYNENQSKYVYTTMYRSTQAAALQNSEKNKFLLKGRFKSTGGDGIPIGAFNVPRGSVVVTVGGRRLVEGIDYQVNYQLGRVRILDPSLQNSPAPIEISVENNTVFGQQTKRFFGLDVVHQFNENFQVGATFLKLTERPFTQKSTFGQESVNNSIFGLNANYSTEVPFLTRLANKLPNIRTDVPSNLSVRGEVAFLQPDTPRQDNFNGESTLYVDDFEGSQSSIDMRSPLAWAHSSVPIRNNSSPYDFFGENNDLSYGYRRSKLSWYSLDPIFFTSQRPADMTDDDFAFNKTRRVFIRELFPVTDIALGENTVVNTLDLAYFPRERGPYNYNPEVASGQPFINPENNFGGIMRGINSTNFEQANVEYIQFWMLDPYVNNEHNPSNQGKIYFNLGEISEDILKDGRKQFENGLPGPGETTATIPTIWGKVPASQSLIYAFDTNVANRASQDVGLDGVSDDEERLLPGIAPGFAAQVDPAADNYEFYLSASGDVIQRYKNYNGLEGNTPVDVTDAFRGNSTLPDVEDVNRDNTMNTVNAYFEYSVNIRPGMQVGQNFITDIRETVEQIELGGGTVNIPARWIQFKIPVFQPERTIGSINDFRSIRFMRMFLTGFSDDIVLRFGTLDLIRGEWRRFLGTLTPENPSIQSNDLAFDVLAVNVEENSNRQPINYVMPPGVIREQVNNNNTIINQNEQSLALRVAKDPESDLGGLGGLEAGDARAVFKNVEIDMRQFNKLRMFLHAEAIESNLDANRLQDDEMIAFIRFGNDFTENFYQVEIPLKVTAHGETDPTRIWPLENELELTLANLTQLKILSRQDPVGPNEIFFRDEIEIDPSAENKSTAKLRLGIRGNPNFGLVRTLMVGVKNAFPPTPDQKSVRGEVWFNELRVSDMNNKGGMAAVLNVDSNMADFMTVSAVGRMSTIGFGALEQGANERSREDMKQYDVVTNFSLGKLLPPKWGINLPFNYAIGEQFITPEYDPFNQDIRLQQLIDLTEDVNERNNIRDRAIDYTRRQSINFIGVRKERGPDQIPRIYDVENFTFSHSYNITERHDFEIEDFVDQSVNSTVDYTYAFVNKPVEPLKNFKPLKDKKYWKLLSDFNFNYLPSNINFSTNIIRQYNRQQFRNIGIDGIPIRPLFRRNYMFNYSFGFNYNLTKSLKVNYNANRSNLVRNYLDANNVPDDDNLIWDDYWDIGDPNMHNQTLIVNYELPLNKIPFLSFLKSDYSYTGSYMWQRASTALTIVPDTDGNLFNLGNTIQNQGAHRLNSTFNMELFYKYIGLVKGPKKKQDSAPKAPPKPGEKIQRAQTNQQGQSNKFLDFGIGLLTTLKNVQVNYTHNTGIALPGFTESLGFFGTSRPSLAFTLGLQDDVRFEAARRGWLTSFPEFNQPYTQTLQKQLNITAKLEPIPDLSIDLVADRNYLENFSEQYDVSNGVYNPRSPNMFGNYSISTILINTAFRPNDENFSEVFNTFRENRLVIAQRLAERFYGTTNYPTVNNPNDPNFGYPLGFGKNAQEVLIPAFMAAYSGNNPESVSLSAFRNIPLPNWNIKYTGLMKLAFFKEKFRRFSIQHNYSSAVTINSFNSNLFYDQTPGATDDSGNRIPRTLIGNINLVEQFNPLVRLEFETKTAFRFSGEVKRDRLMSLSFDNNLLTEVIGQEYVLGLGYRIKNVRIFPGISGDQAQVQNDLNIRGDFSIRDNKTIVRYLDVDNNLLGGGQNILSARITTDYAFNKNLTAIFTYDHIFNAPVVSTAFPITNIRAFFTLRYNFGN